MFIEGYKGKLNNQKRQREIIPALLGNALLAEDELHIAMQLEFDEQEQIIVSFFEYYRFLDRIVSAALEHEIGERILVRIKMPSTIALPKCLLDPRVAIFHDLEVESQSLSEQGIEHLSLDFNFKLYSWSAGTNDFTVSFVSPQGHNLPTSKVALLEEHLQTIPADFDYFSEQSLQGAWVC